MDHNEVRIRLMCASLTGILANPNHTYGEDHQRIALAAWNQADSAMKCMKNPDNQIDSKPPTPPKPFVAASEPA